MLPSSTKDISGEIQSVKACDTRVCHGTICVFKIAGWGENIIISLAGPRPPLAGFCLLSLF